MEDIAAALVPINQPVVACNPVSFPLYKNPICAPEEGKVEDVWLTVVDPVIVGEDKGPKLREEQDRELQVIVPLELIAPQVIEFEPMEREVVKEVVFQQHLNISA